MKWFSKRDIIAVAALLAAALLMLLIRQSGSEGLLFELISDGEVILSEPLEPDRSITPDIFPHVTLTVKDGQVAFTESDCPDHTCVRTGYIGYKGQISACLPNGLILRIRGVPEVDAVV